MVLDYIRHAGPEYPEAVMVLEPGNELFTSTEHRSLLQECLVDAGLDPKSVAIVRCAPAYPEDMKGDDGAIKAFIASYRPKMIQALSRYKTKVVIATGSQVLTQFMNGTPFKVSEYSAKVKQVNLDVVRNVITVTSLNYAVDSISPIPMFKAEFSTLKKFKEANYEYSTTMFVQSSKGYEWRIDLSDLVENKPKSIAFDTETTGLDWKLDSVYPIVGQMTHTDNQAILTPLADDYFTDYFKGAIDNILTFINFLIGNKEVSDIDYGKVVEKIISQWKSILEDPDVKVIGHNIKFDMHMISKVGIEIENVFLDTLQVLHAIDENSKRNNLDIAVKRYVPDLFGYADCVDPDAEILTADMRKVKAKDIEIGQEICAFDEMPTAKSTRRSMRVATITNKQRIIRPKYKITTESGRTTTVSSGHLMLTKVARDRSHKWQWVRAEDLVVSDNLKPFPWEDYDTTRESAYVAGLLDGEGWVCSRQSKVGFSQIEGPVLDRFEEYINVLDINIGCRSFDKRKDKRIANHTFHGHEAFRLLQKTRPIRLLGQHRWEGCGLPTQGHVLDPILSIEKVEDGVVIGLETTTGTLIVDGLLSHNCFNEETDKSNMIEVHPDDMISYAGGDTDATFRLAKAVYKIASNDPSNLNVLMKVRMPALKSLYRLEKTGIRIDSDKLPELSKLVAEDLKERRIELMKTIPKKILRRQAWNKESMSGRADVLVPGNKELMTDAFFSEEGCGFEPLVFTKGTAKKGKADKEPTLSVKDHLSYFFDTGEELLFLYDEYKKIDKLASTYIGNDDDEEKLKGLYKYIHYDYDTGETRVHTNFAINTTTGRTSSKRPNIQNLPQGRGDENNKSSKVAKGYKELYIASEGFDMVEIDYSQAEVRLVAQASQDKELLRIYREGLDVYREVAATLVMGISLEQFEKLPKDVQKAKRQAAKAVVLGFLYGMYPKKFKAYAKTTFGVEFTLEEAERIREDFFNYFSGVAKWHESQKASVHANEYVKALHGATRHLPGIKSKDKWITLSNERDAVNNPIQGCASDMGLIALNCIYKDIDPDIVRPINFVHDAIYFEVKKEYTKEYISYLKWYMENIPLKELFNLELDLPLVADVSLGTSFADKQEIEVEARKPEFCTL